MSEVLYSVNENVLYTVNEYDRDGYIIDPGVFLHIGPFRIKVAETLEELDAFDKSINQALTQARNHLQN